MKTQFGFFLNLFPNISNQLPFCIVVIIFVSTHHNERKNLRFVAYMESGNLSAAVHNLETEKA